MSRDVLTVGSTMRIPLLYRGEYSQWVERFMNYIKEQTDGEAMINSIKNGDQPLPCVTQVSIFGTSSTEQPPLKDKSMWSDQEKRILKIDRLARSLLIQGLLNDLYSLIDSNKTAKDLWDTLARHMLGSEYGKQDRKAVVLYEYETFKATEGELLLDTYIRYLQYATMMRQNNNLMDINIDALYNILKQNQGDVNDAMGSKKKTAMVTSDSLALIVEKTKVSKSKEKVVVSSDSEGSDADDFNKLKNITALLAKAYNQRKFYSKPTNNNLRTLSTSQSANKKQEFVKTDNKKVEKKDDEKKRDMSIVKCYNFLSDSEASSSSAGEKISEISYYFSEYESESKFETSEYYDNSTNYGLFVNNDDDQEIFHDAIDFASENFIENHIDSQKDYDKYDVDHNDSEEKYQLVNKLIRKFNKKIVKCQNRVEKANQQSKDFENQNKDLQDKYDVLKNQTTIFEMNNKELNEQLKELIEKNNDLLAQTNVLKDQLQVKHVMINTHVEWENPKVIAPGMFKLNVSQCVSPISMSKSSCDSENVEIKLKRKRRKRKSWKQNVKQVDNDVSRANSDFVHFSHLDTFNSVRRPKHSSAVWKKKGPSNTSNVGFSAVSVSNLNKNVKRYSRKDLLACNNSHLGETSSAYMYNDAMNVSCNPKLYDVLDDNNFFIFDDENVRIYTVSKMPFRKKPHDSMHVRSKSNLNKSLPRTMHKWLPKLQPLAEPIAKWFPRVKRNRALLKNFVEKFLGTVRFGNNDFAVIVGYGNVVIGALTIKKVYYVEGLRHNLFSVGQFCDNGLEVAFRKSTCFVRNKDGVDLHTGDRSSNLYTIALNEVASNSSTCLLAKAFSSQSWLWHQRLSHLNFATITNLVKNNLVQGLPKMKFEKDHLCSACEQGKIHWKHHKSKTTFSSNKPLYLLHMDLCGLMCVQSINGKRYVLVVVDDYSWYTWVFVTPPNLYIAVEYNIGVLLHNTGSRVA
nr:retrovirus-related Pol polyprotein from transposon TNT 1-94 [Tanacetum cinerariifolium]